MSIEKISGFISPIITEANKPKSDIAEFGSVFAEFIGSVNNDQLKSSEITQSFIKGEDVEIHEVMIAGEKAKTSLELLMEIRNKTIDMFRELTRMSV
jgi:flagellar hook-basal body complex protein FliE